jgi:hypothetical protein
MNSHAHSNSFKPRTAAFMAAFFSQAQVSPIAQPRARKRRTLRTYMYVDGRIHDARIDMHTGEVRQHEYKNRFRQSPRISPNPKLQQMKPFWMQSIDPMLTVSSGEPKPDEKDVSRIKMANSAKEELQLYVCLRDAVEDFPQLDDIICGATSLDLGGNTRGLNRAHIFTLLQQLDVISAFQVRKFAGHSKSHSEKVAVCLRIIVRAFAASLCVVENPSLT